MNAFHLLREEEIKWYERAKTKNLLEGDDNTRYFHLLANGKHKKQHTFKLKHEDGELVGDAELKEYITNYYKGFFGPPEENNFTMVEVQILDITQVTEEENNLLTAPRTEKEIKEAVLQMEHNKSLVSQLNFINFSGRS